MKFIQLRSLFFAFSILFLFNQCSQLVYGKEPTSPTHQSFSSSELNLRSEIADYASELIGSKYAYGGTSARSGFDCSGLTNYVFAHHDIDLSHNAAAQEKEGEKIEMNSVAAGDLIFFRRSRGGRVFHVALVVENNADGIVVIHSTSSRGVIRENITQSSYWSSKIASARLMITK